MISVIAGWQRWKVQHNRGGKPKESVHCVIPYFGNWWGEACIAKATSITKRVPTYIAFRSLCLNQPNVPTSGFLVFRFFWWLLLSHFGQETNPLNCVFCQDGPCTVLVASKRIVDCFFGWIQGNRKLMHGTAFDTNLQAVSQWVADTGSRQSMEVRNVLLAEFGRRKLVFYQQLE